MRGRAEEGQHRHSKEEETRDVPTVGVDYMWMGEEGDERHADSSGSGRRVRSDHGGCGTSQGEERTRDQDVLGRT